MNTEIYLDANATSAVLPAALVAAEQAMRECYGNPSSTHASGLRAKALLDGVRARARRLLGAGSGSLIFTSGATEAIQTAVLSALCAVRERQLRGEPVGTVLVYGATEHKAVPEALAHWNHVLGTELELHALPVDQDGRHRLDILGQLVGRAALVCTMAANNETAVISDLAGIAAVLRAAPDCAWRALWMVDSVQALGKIDIDLEALGVDYAPFSGHKLYAPKGVGILYVRQGSPYTPLMAGGGQEDGQRAGTENMAGIAALGAVLAALEDGHTFRSGVQLAGFRDRLADALRSALPGLVFNTPFDKALPTTLNFSVPGFASKELLDVFDAAGVRVSGGSACSSSMAAPSYVLEAMHLPPARASAAVRMSFGPLADATLIDAACARIARCGEALRAAGLLMSDRVPTARDALVQFSSEGASTWLVADSASGSCVVIDAQAQLNERVATYVRCHRYTVRGIVDTGGGADRALVRGALQALLAGQLDRADGSDALGWPAASDCVELGEAMLVNAITLGHQVLARLPHDVGNFSGASYLLGPRSAGADGAGILNFDDVYYAFTGALGPAGAARAQPQMLLQPMQACLRTALQRLAEHSNRNTILCSAGDERALACTNFAGAAAHDALFAELLSANPRLARAGTAAASMAAGMDAGALERFMLSHPDAMLVDVREACEHLASAAPSWRGRVAQHVALSTLAGQAGQWLRAGQQRPLVFFCRSGKRAARAAQCLRQLGYANAWHVTGAFDLHPQLARAA